MPAIMFGLFFNTANRLSASIYLGKSVKQVYMLLALFCFVPAAFCQEAYEIKLAAFEYHPFFSNQSNIISGIGVDLGNELFRRLDFRTKLDFFPLKRALMYVKNGDVDGIMILVNTADRTEYLIYTRPIISASGYIWSAADREAGAVNFEHVEDLRSYKVGVTIGYSYGSAMDEFLRSMDTDSAPTEFNSFKKLLLHRVDIIPATDIIVKSLMKKYPEFKGKFIHSDKPFLESAYYMGISKKSGLARMMPLINKTILEMKEDGTVDEVIKKYTE